MSGPVAVLEWRAWDGFLLAHVLGDHAVRIETDPFRGLPTEVFDRVCGSVTTVCFQINLSVRDRLPLRVRDLTRRLVERGIHVVNGLVQDIRKSALHAHLDAIGLASPKASRSGPPDEMLFVKSELNYGGELERAVSPEHAATSAFGHQIFSEIGYTRYHAVERGKLRKERWRDPALVVEKYVANAEDSFYRAYFSGKQIIIVKAFAPGPIKKLSNDPRDTNYLADLEALTAGVDHLPLSPTLKRDVATFVERTPVEFGCVDIVHDGHDRHYIVDLNLTPYAGSEGPDFLHDFLREGITNPSRRKSGTFVDSPLTTTRAALP